MPTKSITFMNGQTVSLKSVLLPNGNLLIPRRMGHDRTMTEWVEVAPGTSDYRRWLPVATDMPDPRDSADYQQRQTNVQNSDSYQQWLSEQGDNP